MDTVQSTCGAARPWTGILTSQRAMGTTRRPGGCIATSRAAIITTTATTAAAATTVQMKRECVKVKESNIFIGLKKTCLGVLE